MKSETKPFAFGFLAGAAVWILALFCATCEACARPPSPRSLAAPTDNWQVVRSIRIDMKCGSLTGIAEWVGSGFVLDSTHILTAAHVATCMFADIEITLFDGRKGTAHVDRLWPERDLARLELDGGSFGVVVPLRFAEPHMGEKLCSVSAAPGLIQSCGVFDRRYDMSCVPASLGDSQWCRDGRMLAFVWHGNSGSPVYDTRGNVVAVLTGGSFFNGTELPLGDAYLSMLWDVRDEVLRSER